MSSRRYRIFNKYISPHKYYRYSVDKKLKPSSFTIIQRYEHRDTMYSIELYERGLPSMKKKLIKHLCVPKYNSIYVNEFINSTLDIYLLRNDITHRYEGFVLVTKNSTRNCDSLCFDCDEQCVYISLLCIGAEYRKNGIFRTFFTQLCDYFRSQNKTCIRLTASDPYNYAVYNKLGFHMEEKGVENFFRCEYNLRFDL